MLTAVCYNAKGLLANRFFLGASEACIAPGLTVIVAMWYKRSEQPLRMGAWFMGNVLAGFLGGLVAYGIGHVKSIAPWKVWTCTLLNASLTVNRLSSLCLARSLSHGLPPCTFSFLTHNLMPGF